MGLVGVLAAPAAVDCRKVASPIYILQIGPYATYAASNVSAIFTEKA
jgi:hypothetical protein